jgi:hypothetical protein
MAAIAAIASAIAAWKAQSIASKSFDLQKKISKHQEGIFLLRTTISSLWQLKRILGQPLAASDDEFSSFHNIHRQIRLNLESLVQSRTIEETQSSFFSDLSRAEIVDNLPHANQAIDGEIKRLEVRVNEIFA